MKRQVVVRTFPTAYLNPTDRLEEYLKNGYVVVMCNKFVASGGFEGNEYILEKQDDNA